MSIEHGKVAAWAAIAAALATVAYIAIKTPIHAVRETNSAVAASHTNSAAATEQNTLSAQSTHETNNQDTSLTSGQVTVMVYYFHTTARCDRCIRMEEWTKEALLTGFPDALKDGRLQWRPVDIDRPENEHFLDDYQLTDKSVVVARFNGDNRIGYKVLEDTWSLLDNKDGFLHYVRGEVMSHLSAEL